MNYAYKDDIVLFSCLQSQYLGSAWAISFANYPLISEVLSTWSLKC